MLRVWLARVYGCDGEKLRIFTVLESSGRAFGSKVLRRAYSLFGAQWLASGIIYHIPTISVFVNAILPFLIACSSKLWLRYAYKTHSGESRSLAVNQIVNVLNRWEAICISETLECCYESSYLLEGDNFFLSNLIGSGPTEVLLKFWNKNWNEKKENLMSSKTGNLSETLVQDFLLEDYIELYYFAEQTFTLSRDKKLLLRLSFVVQYALFRRLCFMEECRLLRSLTQRTEKHGCEGAIDEDVWRICGKPSWLLHNIRNKDEYFCLPLSYMPIESVLPHTANWLYDGKLDSIVASWTKSPKKTMDEWYRSINSVLTHEICLIKEGNRRCVPSSLIAIEKAFFFDKLRILSARSVVNYFFFRYTSKMIAFQKRIAKETAISFYRNHLFQRKENFLCESLKSTYPNAQFRSKQLFSLFLLQGSFTALMSSLLYFSSSVVSPFLFLVSNEEDKCGHYALRTVLSVILKSTIAAVANLIIRSFRERIEKKISNQLQDALLEKLLALLVSTDLTFLDRFLEERKNTSVKKSSSVYFQQAGSFFESDIKECASNLLACFGNDVHNLSTITCMSAAAIYRGELIVLLFASAVVATERIILSMDSLMRLYPSRLPSILAHQESHHQRKYGLMLLVDILSELPEIRGVYNIFQEKGKGILLNTNKLSRFKLYSSSPLRTGNFPFVLASLACGNISAQDWLLLDKDLYIFNYEDILWNQLFHKLRHLEALYYSVLHFLKGKDPFFEDDYISFSTLFQSMHESAHWVLLSVVYPGIEQLLRLRGEGNSSVGDLFREDCKEKHFFDLDPEEEEIIIDRGHLKHLPEKKLGVSCFSPQIKFVLKQLGIESIMGAELRHRHVIDKSFSDLLRNAFLNSFVAPFRQFVDIVEVGLLTYAGLAKIDVNTFRIYGRKLPYLSCHFNNDLGRQLLLKYDHFSAYKKYIRNILRNECDRKKFSFFCVSDLFSGLPCSNIDSPRSFFDAELTQRRLLWRQFLWSRSSEKSLVFDEKHRVIGGFNMKKGIRFHNVSFLYPHFQHHLHGEMLGDSLKEDMINPSHAKPALYHVTMTFPAQGLTAIIGKTGSGKSTIFHLLKRTFEPVPVFSIENSEGTALRSSEIVWSRDTVKKIIQEKLIDYMLPLPPQSDGKKLFSSDFAVDSSQYISFDDIPSSCFSPAYQREWLLQLESDPHMLYGKTYEENIKFVYSTVRRIDLERAALASGCHEFINSSALKMSESLFGLSTGEQQRLGLARILAAAFAQCRRFRLGNSYQGHQRDNGPALGTSCPTVVALLLDEPTNRLDGINEIKFNLAIKGLLSRNDGVRPDELFPSSSENDESLGMIIVIAHRLTTVQFASHVVVISDGEIEAEGSPQTIFRISPFAKKQLQLQKINTVKEENMVDLAPEKP